MPVHLGVAEVARGRRDHELVVGDGDGGLYARYT